MGTRADANANGGIGLVEVTVALGLCAMLLASTAPVTAAIVRAVSRARLQARAAAAATSQLERLCALSWYHLPGGALVTDVVSLVDDDGFGANGPGLAPGPPDSLEVVTGGYEDTPGDLGQPLTTAGRLTRRWRVSALASDPGCVVLVVEVAATLDLDAGQSMLDAALARAQTVRCAGGARP
jgi:type II secretory pathway pseudopilin PulG